jgi:hypothetical protein
MRNQLFSLSDGSSLQDMDPDDFARFFFTTNISTSMFMNIQSSTGV